MAHTDVLISGAGPTGLTLAIDLARRGVAVQIIERTAQPQDGSRGKGIQPRSLEVFEDLGVLDAMLAHGRPYPHIRAYAGDQVVHRGPMQEESAPTPDVPYPNALMLPQWCTVRLLRERLTELGVAVRLGTELLGFVQDENGVTATLTDGTVRARYLVGADGGRSPVRKTLGVGFEGETTETERMVIGDFPVRGELDREYWHFWGVSAHDAVGLCPLPSTENFQLSAPLLDVAEDAPVTAEFCRALFAQRSGRTDLELGEPSWLSLYRTNVRMVDTNRVGRVFLAGDAAHVHSPAGGQGLNTGVQDAYNLGWKLAAVLRGGSDALLESYRSERLAVAAEVLGLSSRYHRGLTSDSSTPGRRGEDTKQLGVNYRGGLLAVESRDAANGPQAGDRAPDAPCHTDTGTPVRLFDLFRGPHATVLAFGARYRDWAAGLGERFDLRGYSVGGTLVDTDGHIRDAYHAEEGTLLLIRPDGYLGFAGTDQAKLEAFAELACPAAAE